MIRWGKTEARDCPALRSAVITVTLNTGCVATKRTIYPSMSPTQTNPPHFKPQTILPQHCRLCSLWLFTCSRKCRADTTVQYLFLIIGILLAHIWCKATISYVKAVCGIEGGSITKQFPRWECWWHPYLRSCVPAGTKNSHSDGLLLIPFREFHCFSIPRCRCCGHANTVAFRTCKAFAYNSLTCHWWLQGPPTNLHHSHIHTKP